MHAVVTRVTVNDRDAATSQLRENVVPGVAQAPGFVAGYWTRADDGTGLSMVIFESEEAATNMSERVPSIVPDAVTLENVEVREVVAHAWRIWIGGKCPRSCGTLGVGDVAEPGWCDARIEAFLAL